MDVADIKAVEGDAVGLGGGAFAVASLPILLCFCELGNDWNPEELLSGKLNSFLY